jgi:outer membrane protein OmpA-like peptidoglycan-associated protein
VRAQHDTTLARQAVAGIDSTAAPSSTLPGRPNSSAASRPASLAREPSPPNSAARSTPRDTTPAPTPMSNRIAGASSLDTTPAVGAGTTRAPVKRDTTFPAPTVETASQRASTAAPGVESPIAQASPSARAINRSDCCGETARHDSDSGSDEDQSLRPDGFDSAIGRLGPCRELLARAAQVLTTHPVLRLELGGHADSTGSRALNVRLSEQRAAAVRTFLTGLGIASDRLAVVGHGPHQPAEPNTTRAGRARNRRVELLPLE